MDFEKLADEFIAEGGWQGSPRIAIELFAKWLAEHEAAQQSVQPTLLESSRHGSHSCECGLCKGSHTTLPQSG